MPLLIWFAFVYFYAPVRGCEAADDDDLLCGAQALASGYRGMREHRACVWCVPHIDKSIYTIAYENIWTDPKGSAHHTYRTAYNSHIQQPIY